MLAFGYFLVELCVFRTLSLKRAALAMSASGLPSPCSKSKRPHCLSWPAGKKSKRVDMQHMSCQMQVACSLTGAAQSCKMLKGPPRKRQGGSTEHSWHRHIADLDGGRVELLHPLAAWPRVRHLAG